MTPRALDGCVKCGACLRECPVLRLEGGFPGPRRLAVEGPRFNRELASLRGPLEACTTCARCESSCPSRLPLTEAVARMRAAVPADSEGRRRMLAMVRSTGRTLAPEGCLDAPRDGRTLFFPGCVGEARTLASTQAAVDLLGRLDDVYVPEGWSCCGSPLERIGETKEAERLRATNAPLLDAAEQVVTACPGCAVQLRRAHRIEPLHVLEHLYEVVGPRRLHLRSPRPVRVAVHSPCHLVRSIGPHAMDYAREILSSVEGLTVVDLDEDECCGGGGGVASARPDLALRLARRKTDAAARAGAELLLAPCPFCVVNLSRAGGIEIRDLVGFLASLSEDRS